MNCMKNGTKKSALRLVGNTAQTISSTAAALSGGIAQVDTGCSIEPMSSGSRILSDGLYQVQVSAQVTATAAGTVTLQLYMDGTALPDTLRTVTAAEGQTEITTGTLLCLCHGCCCGRTLQACIGGTVTGTATAWSMDVIKQA